jgi:hypothetical protein
VCSWFSFEFACRSSNARLSTLRVKSDLVVCFCFAAQIAFAQSASTPSLEQRVADLEAYINNSARAADAAHVACGYVDPTGAVIIGIAAGVVPFFACTKSKSLFHYDDALDTFGIHAVGGTLGAFLTGFLATARANPNLSATVAAQNGLARIVGHMLWFEQLKAILVTIAFAVIGTTILGALVKVTIGLRIAPEIERQGLDINEHGEEGYVTA